MYMHSVLMRRARRRRASGVVVEAASRAQTGCPRWLRQEPCARCRVRNMKEGVPVRAFGCYRSMYYANEVLLDVF